MDNRPFLRRAFRRQALWAGLALTAGGLIASGAVLVTSCGGSAGSPDDAGEGGVEGGGDVVSVIDFDGPPDSMPVYDSDDASDADAVALFDGASCQALTCPGKCVAGRCLFQLVQGGAFDLTLQSGMVYWTNAGTAPGEGTVLGLPTTPIAPTDTPLVYAVGQNSPQPIAVNATTLYWANDSETAGAVLSVPLTLSVDAGAADAALEAGSDAGDAGPVRPITPIATGQSSPDAIAINATTLYWTVAGVAASESGLVMSRALAGGAAVTLASGRVNPSAIAVDSENVYWVDTGSTGTDGAVLAAPLHGQTITTLASGLATPGAIALSDTDVYFTNQGVTASDAAIEMVAKGGGTPSTVVGEQPPLRDILLDGTTLYWTVSAGSGTGGVFSFALGGDTVVTLMSGLDYPLDLATDTTSLYWTDSLDGTIEKLTPK
jgi:hypothetical protein